MPAHAAGRLAEVTALEHVSMRWPMCAGRLSEVERDRVEAQVGDFIRTCKENITKLQDSVAAQRASLSPDTTAHRLGVVRSLPFSPRNHVIAPQ